MVWDSEERVKEERVKEERVKERQIVHTNGICLTLAIGDNREIVDERDIIGPKNSNGERVKQKVFQLREKSIDIPPKKRR